MNTTARNILIIVAIAAAVFLLPGGGQAAAFVGGLLSAAISILFVLLAVRFYRERRIDIFGLGDGHRAVLYASLAAVVFVLAALRRAFDAGGAGILAWCALIGAAAYGLYAVFRHYRAYA